jgi:hypothetical protein
MSTAFDTAPNRTVLPMANDPHPGAYRTSAGVVCARCGSNAGDDYTFTNSGDVHCRACAKASAQALATDTASSAGDEFAGERRCKCGGVASAGKIVNHARLSVNMYARAMGESIETGGETVFGCTACGQSFSILNRLRRIRLAVRAFQCFFLGLVFGAAPFAFLPAFVAIVPGAVIALLTTYAGSSDLWRDIYLRRARPAIV